MKKARMIKIILIQNSFCGNIKLIKFNGHGFHLETFLVGALRQSERARRDENLNKQS